MVRLVFSIWAFIALTFIGSSLAEATKPTPNCANVRCATGSCIDTPEGPICHAQTLSCANVLCQQGNKCVESPTGPKCVPHYSQPTYPTYPNYPTYPSYPQQSCAYGGHYYNGRLVCNQAPSWRHPYQYGYGYYYQPPRYYPPAYYPPRRNYGAWYHYGNVPEQVEVGPTPNDQIMCPAVYDPVCAEKAVQCVRAPCPAVRQTFGNNCEASREGYSVIHRGACR